MDDLMGMDFTAPAKQQKQGATKAQGNYGRTTFDYLAASGSTQQPAYRSSSPLAPSISPASTRPTSPAVQTKPASSAANGGADAFAGLFGAPSGGAGGGAKAGATLSMAERLAQESAAKIGALGAISTTSTSWAALNPSRPASAASTGRSSPAVSLQPTRQASTSSAASSAKATVATSATSTPDPWDFDLLAPTTSASKPPSTTANSDDPFGLGFGSAPAPSAARLGVHVGNGKTVRRQRSFMDDDGDADYASNEDGLLGGGRNGGSYGGDEDDILGALSQPVSQLRVSSPPEASRSSTPASRASPAPRTTASPPPHVLGQIVEMGFSIPQASSALQATAGPAGEWNVEAALEALMENQQAEAHTSRQREAEEWGAEVEAEGGRRRPTDDRQRQERPREPEVIEPRPTGRRAREAAAREAAAREANGGAEASGSGLVSGATADQAAELFAQAQKQATKIGFSMFKSASAYVAQGKAAVEKALAEQAEAKARAGGAKGAPSGRPKWMTEDFADGDETTPPAQTRQRPRQEQAAAPAREPPPSLFKDSDDEDHVLPQRSFTSGISQPQPPASRQPPPRQAPPAEAAPAPYKSPWRTAKSMPAPAPSLPPAAAPPAPRPTPTPSPKPARPPRSAVPVSPAALASATAHKTKGNELFKLGRFGDAAAAYSLALAELPAGSLARVPLLNNRAGARLKVGEEKVAIEDCSEAILLILPEGLPAPDGRIDVDGLEQERLPAEAQDVKLVEALGKALGRRAKAREAEEQWTKAGQDWDLVRKSGEVMTRGAGGPKLVSEGAARCRKATSAPPPAPSSAAAAPPPKPKAIPPKPVVRSSGAAVAAHRANEASAEAEDELRFKIKDSVEAKIAGWKAGKEANLRALIASLDTVLWPEVGWVKVGMGELLTEGQVKIRYMKAIAKVHPDKLNVANTTVEQRMIAGLVFAALNEAWTAQK